MEISLWEIAAAAAYANIIVTRGYIFSWLRRGWPLAKLMRCIMCFCIWATAAIHLLNEQPYYNYLSGTVIRIFALGGAAYMVSLLYDIIDAATSVAKQNLEVLELEARMAEARMLNIYTTTSNGVYDEDIK